MRKAKLFVVDPAIETLELNRLRGERLWPTLRRECIRESYTEADGAYIGVASFGHIYKEWTYRYSDGTTETVTVRERRP
jgi:hypothetical protein